MIFRFNDWTWGGIGVHEYKDNPGSWLSVTRQVFNKESESQFEVRYFEVAPNGYTSFERHEHEHLVVVIRGKGKVRLGDEWTDIGTFDAVRVEPNMPHQFATAGDEPLGIICVVDKLRDRPELLRSENTAETSN